MHAFLLVKGLGMQWFGHWGNMLPLEGLSSDGTVCLYQFTLLEGLP